MLLDLACEEGCQGESTVAVAGSLSENFRAKRDLFLRALIAQLPRRDDRLRIVDVGGRA